VRLLVLLPHALERMLRAAVERLVRAALLRRLLPAAVLFVRFAADRLLLVDFQALDAEARRRAGVDAHARLDVLRRREFEFAIIVISIAGT